MKELLERWNELEPGWCEARTNGSYLVGKIAVDGDAVGYRVYPPFTEHISSMRIQYAVQQAIAARGWDFEFSYDDDPRQYFCTIDGRQDCSSGDTPAAALLAAYVQALAGLRVEAAS